MGLCPSFPSGLPATSSQLTPPYFGTAVSPLAPLDSFSALGQSESSAKAMESLLPFTSGAEDATGRARAGSVSAEGLDSLSEYTLPGNTDAQLVFSFSIKCGAKFLGRHCSFF